MNSRGPMPNVHADSVEILIFAFRKQIFKISLKNALYFMLLEFHNIIFFAHSEFPILRRFSCIEQKYATEYRQIPNTAGYKNSRERKAFVTCLYTLSNCAEKKRNVGLSLTLKCHRPRCCIYKRAYVEPPLQIRRDRDSQFSVTLLVIYIDFL